MTLPLPQSAAQQVSKKRQRSREPDWNSFYKNGLPKEVIVIDDSPSPRISESVEHEDFAHPKQNGVANAAVVSRHAAKKRKRDDIYDPIYNSQAGPSKTQSPHHKGSNSHSTISTDRTTSAVQTTAATSLGSQYSNNGSRGFAIDGVQPGQKRKRVATRQQLANEAKRREIEANGDAFSNYHPPPRPPIKAGEVNVKVMQDVRYSVLCFWIKLTLYRTPIRSTARSMTMMDIISWSQSRISRIDVGILLPSL